LVPNNSEGLSTKILRRVVSSAPGRASDREDPHHSAWGANRFALAGAHADIEGEKDAGFAAVADQVVASRLGTLHGRQQDPQFLPYRISTKKPARCKRKGFGLIRPAIRFASGKDRA
jgi:hypothetical protein